MMDNQAHGVARPQGQQCSTVGIERTAALLDSHLFEDLEVPLRPLRIRVESRNAFAPILLAIVHILHAPLLATANILRLVP